MAQPAPAVVPAPDESKPGSADSAASPKPMAAAAAPASAAPASPEPQIEVPPDIEPMYIPDKSLRRWQMKTGPEIADNVPYKKFNKDDIIEEIKQIGYMCEFHAVREKVKVRSNPSKFALWRALLN